MMFADPRDDAPPTRAPGALSESELSAMIRFLAEQGVDFTGSESAGDVSLMHAAVEAFHRAVDSLGGRAAAGDRAFQVVPPRAADETPRQYAERMERMTERFRSLARSSQRGRR